MSKNLFKNNLFKNKYQRLIIKINAFETNLKVLSDDELRIKHFNLQKQYDKNKNLDLLIAESFAITREVSRRTLGLKHFDVQLLGGLVLNTGKITEMKTGEGKTLVATLPAVLNAFRKKGVHIVTVNDYLAYRDQISMSQIYRYLGLNTGLIQASMNKDQRKVNYKADITYVTNNELGFDFLRDNMIEFPQDVVIPFFTYCIIDEVDSVLIDEAQTPLILSFPLEIATDNKKYIYAEEIIDYLELNTDFQLDEKNNNVIITSEGYKKIEMILNIQDLYYFKDPWISYILNAIRARYLYFNNKQYIIEDNRVVIVDEFTGRRMPGRQWSDGLHQAIEIKEKLPIRRFSETMASITYQNFFLSYSKLSGMTGTAKTAEFEFEKIYNLLVQQIPTARPNLRQDLPDFLYKDKLSKWTAIAQECYNVSSIGQPILIGTTTVEDSEMFAQLLNEYKLSYQLLNAKPTKIRKEAEIIAQAGKKGMITISTNMAGRGTDIILGGNLDFQTKKLLYYILAITKTYLNQQNNPIFTIFHQFKKVPQKFLSVLVSLMSYNQFLTLSDVDIFELVGINDRIFLSTSLYQCSIKFSFKKLFVSSFAEHTQDQKIVKNLGGLYVIGTERNDSRRIDNQLRGRCGRQGDPGKSRFFLSLDDRLLRLFGSSEIQRFIKNQISDDSPIEGRFITKSLDNAQRRVEERDYEKRKIIFEYDEILDKQRRIIYFEREKLVKTRSYISLVMEYSEQVIGEIVNSSNSKRCSYIPYLKASFGENFNPNIFLNQNEKPEKIQNDLFNLYWTIYIFRFMNSNSYQIELSLRFLVLFCNDILWKEHLYRMSLLRDSTAWRVYSQRKPLDEYKAEAYALFQELEITLRYLVVSQVFRIRRRLV